MKVSPLDRAAANLLVAARHEIRTPGRWCKQSYAESKNGDTVEETDTTARKFCAIGALNCVSQNGNVIVGTPRCQSLESRKVRRRASDALDAMAGGNMIELNDKDETTHKDVLAVFDKAIRQLNPNARVNRDPKAEAIRKRKYGRRAFLLPA